MNITVYCGVALGNSPAYKQSAIDLGTWMAQAGHTLVYGGGGIGMMGALANAVLDHGGNVLGIIPQFLVDREQLNPRIVNPVVVQTMAERKKLLCDNADAFVMLPGGIGTFEEITEVLSQIKLGFIAEPVFIVNIEGCYDHFVASLNELCRNGFLKEEESPYTVVASIAELAAVIGA
ncbi:MAG: TIGR00730 family Rossman fold protein [Eggerthellaceae bacterium]|nr:TIGR00730 family Rossman fold protein [Eggerthellaceae bacterium]